MPMKQNSLDLSLRVRKTRKREFLAEMESVAPRVALVKLIAPCYLEGRNGRPLFAWEAIGYVKVRYQGLKNNTRQLITRFALSNLWMVRGQFMGAEARLRLQTGCMPCNKRERRCGSRKQSNF